MKLKIETENKIIEFFRNKKFQDYMFKSINGSEKDDEDVPYRVVYKWELFEAERCLINLIKCRVKYGLFITSDVIINFVLEHVVDTLCKNIYDYTDFFNFCYYLHNFIVKVISEYFSY